MQAIADILESLVLPSANSQLGVAMPIITIQQSPGRNADQRRFLMKRITEAFQEAYDLPPEAVTIFFQDYEDDMWGKSGLLHTDRKSQRS
jgi:4-oxalocrotonate tautomerase